MNQVATFLTLAVLSASAQADITGFVPPVATGGGFSNGGFSQFGADGYYAAGSGVFDNHWLLTVDDANPGLTFTVEYSFNPRSGGGALSFNSLTVSGPGVVDAALTGGSAICPIGPGDCISRRVASVAVSAGTYDLHIVGGNPFNGSYRVNVSVVPEPATAALGGIGLLLLALRVRNRSNA